MIKSVLLLVPFLSLVFVLPAQPYSSYQDQAEIIYKSKQNCQTCHLGSKLNYFGLDLQKELNNNQDIIKALLNIENKDSDQDSFNNMQELQQKKSPGDPFNFPNNNPVKAH